MRVNTKQAFDAWRRNKALKPANAIWTDGVRLMSYGTEIARRNGIGAALNGQKYSVTTSCQQTNLRVLFSQNGISFQEYESEADYQHAVNK